VEIIIHEQLQHAHATLKINIFVALPEEQQVLRMRSRYLHDLGVQQAMLDLKFVPAANAHALRSLVFWRRCCDTGWLKMNLGKIDDKDARIQVKECGARNTYPLRTALMRVRRAVASVVRVSGTFQQLIV
jgi:hypothetical protein